MILVKERTIQKPAMFSGFLFSMSAVIFNFLCVRSSVDNVGSRGALVQAYQFSKS